MGALKATSTCSLGAVLVAEELREREYLPSGIGFLDRFLGGGLPVGALTEWAMPLGGGGREILLPWIARMKHLVQPQWVLWIHSHSCLEIYPPAWAARGVALDELRFARTHAPLKDLRPIFLEPLFKLIIIDSPENFSDDDCAFVARQARRLDQVVVLLRQEMLGLRKGDRYVFDRLPRGKKRRQDAGNIWARLRLNLWNSEPPLFKGAQVSSENEEQEGKDSVDISVDWDALAPIGRTLWLEVVRGLPPRCLKFSTNKF